MEQDLISKKNLLERYSISYGALYRWKRKGLIPEEWFIKKSTPTGQETFFPKDLICERMELILSQKDVYSLDELLNQFSEKDEKKSMLVIDTIFGKKSFYVTDIKSILLENTDGTTLDITKKLLNE